MQDDVWSHICAETSRLDLVAFDVLSIAALLSSDDDLHDNPCSDMLHVETDDVFGDSLQSNMSTTARKEELDYFASMHAYEDAFRRSALRRRTNRL